MPTWRVGWWLPLCGVVGMVRVDGADASHDLIGHLSSPRKTMLFTCGWTIMPADEDAHPPAPGRRVEARHRPGRQHRGRQGRRGDHRPDDHGGELARRPALDRPPGEAVAAANIAADLAAWTRLLGHADDPELRDADPGTLRYRIWHLPARLAAHARQRTLAISTDWPRR